MLCNSLVGATEKELGPTPHTVDDARNLVLFKHGYGDTDVASGTLQLYNTPTQFANARGDVIARLRVKTESEFGRSQFNRRHCF